MHHYPDRYEKQNIAYCRKCGTKLDVTKKLSYYDSVTGKPKYELLGRCPNKIFFFPSWHTEEILELVD